MPARDPVHNEYSEKLDATFDAENTCWVCARCFGVLGSAGCCRAGWREAEREHREAKEAKRKAQGKPRREPYDWSRRGGPFEVRLVDVVRRSYVAVGVMRDWYHDACLAADALRAGTPDDYVVIDRGTKQVLYDSRLFRGRK